MGDLSGLERIRLLLLDVDGVLTDGRLWFDGNGEALKCFHVRDGHGIKELQAAGVAVAVISGRRSAAVQRRMVELGVHHVLQGCSDKAEALSQVLAATGVTAAATACLVDDIPDLPLMRAVGFPFAVADAHASVLAAARYVTRTAGGAGAVRELCDLLLRARRPSDRGTS
jgi:3-deoxy-D-manno-octulosonate 8-phosphate phosphatase (KDO 8-P phosphatase)